MDGAEKWAGAEDSLDRRGLLWDNGGSLDDRRKARKMGYTTEFEGKIENDPPLSEREIEYLKKFAGTRRMDRAEGPYFVEGTGPHGQGRDKGIRDYNRPPEGQPGLWCQWVPTEDVIPNKSIFQSRLLSTRLMSN